MLSYSLSIKYKNHQLYCEKEYFEIKHKLFELYKNMCIFHLQRHFFEGKSVAHLDLFILMSNNIYRLLLTLSQAALPSEIKFVPLKQVWFKMFYLIMYLFLL